MTNSRKLRHVASILVLGLATAGCPADTGIVAPGGDPPGGDDPGSYNHLRSVGASAGDLLDANDFDRLVVEIQYVGGFAPSAAGLQSLGNFLNARLNKPAGITVMSPQSIQISQQATYTAAEIRAIEQTHRTAYTEGTTLAVYFLFIDGEFAENANVLGIAYNNTSMAVFEERISQLTGGLGQPSRTTVEATVVNHEVGHILGLVNNGSAMQTNHQDVSHGHHCDDPDCLMYWAVDTSDFLDNLLGGSVPALNQDCLEDLQANGGK